MLDEIQCPEKKCPSRITDSLRPVKDSGEPANPPISSIPREQKDRQGQQREDNEKRQEEGKVLVVEAGDPQRVEDCPTASEATPAKE